MIGHLQSVLLFIFVQLKILTTTNFFINVIIVVGWRWIGLRLITIPGIIFWTLVNIWLNIYIWNRKHSHSYYSYNLSKMDKQKIGLVEFWIKNIKTEKIFKNNTLGMMSHALKLMIKLRIVDWNKKKNYQMIVR